MNNPLISVIIPVYNCEKTISIALESIINQTYKNLEIIVVNDASTDNTKKIVEEISKKDTRIKVVDSESDPNRFDKKLNRNVNAGYSARNTGFKYAKGALITFQDADDASFLNRIEIQFNLLEKYNSTHLTLDWINFDEKYLNKKLLSEKFLNNLKILSPNDLYLMSQRSKGFVARISTSLNKITPFHLKRLRIIHRLFFGSYENYPGAGNSPLFKREVTEKVKFRNLKERTWPSFMGRGADKDFNFQVAETFKNSHVCFIPLYMWRVEKKTENYEGEIFTE
ncbi:MAG: glycosyltransferase family 2 protein [Candidatus Paceibacterota bacterium]|jgi:glycosyltransferase involved in cell wall biosynthesis